MLERIEEAPRQKWWPQGQKPDAEAHRGGAAANGVELVVIKCLWWAG